MYSVECRCGHTLPVQLYQAGTTVECPQCRQPVSVPSSTKLQTASGDKNPFLSPLEKIARAAAANEYPFQGECHRCHKSSAAFAILIQFQAMLERQLLTPPWIWPSITGRFLIIGTGKSEEQWITLRFPLLLCSSCHGDFVVARRKADRRWLLKNLVLFGLLGAFLYVVFVWPELIYALAGVISLIGFVAWVANLRDKKKGESFLMSWLEGIRWVPEAIRSEQEYVLEVEETRPYAPRTAVSAPDSPASPTPAPDEPSSKDGPPQPTINET